MSRNRLIFLLLMGCYLGFMVPGQAINAAIVSSIGLVVTVAIFAHLLLGPARSFGRRLCAMTADITTICTVLHLGGETTSCFLPLVLWTVFGNGLRFGRRSLLRAMALGLIGLSTVVLTTPFWRANLPLSAGTLVAVVLLPLYSLSLLDRLSAATRQAEAANGAKTLFLANVSHEMRTPLHAIVGMGSLLESLKLAPEAAEMVRTIMDAAARLTEFIDDLLGLTASETGGFQSSIDAFSIVELLTEVRALSQAQADTKNLRVNLHVGFGTPIRLTADKRHLRQVLLNLVSNALKFTEQGGVLIIVRALQAGPIQALLRFEVVDTGIGIAPTALDHVFKPFMQADRSITERFGGTGLGLAICKQIVEGLDGNIGAESRVGVGTTIWFEVHCGIVAVEQEEVARRGSIAVLSMDAPIHDGLRCTILECHSDALFFDSQNSSPADILAEVATLQRPVLLMQPASRALAEPIEAAIAGMPATQSPALVLVASTDTDPVMAGLTWAVRTWLPANFDETQLSTALRTAAELSTFERRSAGDAGTMAGVGGDDALTTRAPRGERQDLGHQALRSRPLSVLVADDSKVNQRVVAKILQMGGHSYEVVGDGDMALDAMTDGRFDVVLMDVNMPNTNGLDATKLYRMGALGMPWLPILGLTADATAEMERSCLEAGMDGRLVKPVRAERLLDAIDAAVGAVATRTPQKFARSGSSSSSTRELAHVPTLDDGVLTSLRSIAGADADKFLEQVMTEYFTEVEAILARLEAVVAMGGHDDVPFHAHAIASISGNVGAARLRQVAHAIECMRSDEIRTLGQREISILRSELAELWTAWNQKTWRKP